MALRRRAADDISRAVVPVVSAARGDTAQAQPRRARFLRPQLCQVHMFQHLGSTIQRRRLDLEFGSRASTMRADDRARGED